MTRNGIILLLALGASAEVPHWMGEGKQTEYPQSPNSRRLFHLPYEGEAAGCNAACPGAQEYVANEERTGFSQENLKATCSPSPPKLEKCMAATQDCWPADMPPEMYQALLFCVCKCVGGITDEATMKQVLGLCTGEVGKGVQQPSVAHPACSVPSSSASAPEPPSVVTVAFEIKGISLTDLDGAAEDGLKKDLAKGLAKQTGVPQDKITITLEAASRRLAEGKSGGIKVKADIETDDPDTVERESKKTDTTALVKDSATLQQVVEKKGMTMDDISATEPTVTVKKGSKKKAVASRAASGSGVALSVVLVMMAVWWSSQ